MNACLSSFVYTYVYVQVPLDPVVHKAIQVFQVFPVIKEVWDYQAPLADMGPQVQT